MSSLLEYFWWPSPINDIVKEDKKLKLFSCFTDIVRGIPDKILFKLLDDALEEAIDTESDINAIKNQLDIIKLIFYKGDIQEGEGERDIFKKCLKWLDAKLMFSLEKNIHLIPYYTRYDNIFELFSGKNEIRNTEKAALSFFCERIISNMMAINDNEIENLDNCAKWFPSENKKWDKERGAFKKICKYFNKTPKEIRTLFIKPLRNAYEQKWYLVERKLCNKETDINYDKVPKIASKMYAQNAFWKNNRVKYSNWKINNCINKYTNSGIIISNYETKNYDDMINILNSERYKLLKI